MDFDTQRMGHLSIERCEYEDGTFVIAITHDGDDKKTILTGGKGLYAFAAFLAPESEITSLKLTCMDRATDSMLCEGKAATRWVTISDDGEDLTLRINPTLAKRIREYIISEATKRAGIDAL